MGRSCGHQHSGVLGRSWIPGYLGWSHMLSMLHYSGASGKSQLTRTVHRPTICTFFSLFDVFSLWLFMKEYNIEMQGQLEGARSLVPIASFICFECYLPQELTGQINRTRLCMDRWYPHEKCRVTWKELDPWVVLQIAMFGMWPGRMCWLLKFPQPAGVTSSASLHQFQMPSKPLNGFRYA